jgi:hypothetical protein
MKQRALKLLRRGNELHMADYRYQSLIYHLRDLFTRMPGSEFAAKIDRKVLQTLEDTLEHEIRPGIVAAREEYVRLCGFEWDDWVRIQNPGVAAVELVATDLYFHPFRTDPYAWLHGRALKANGRPGNKGVQTRLVAGTSKVTVLSEAATRR